MRKESPRRPSITRRDALVAGGASAIAATLTPSRAAEPVTIRVAYAAAAATLDPAKMRVGGLDYNYCYCVFNRLTTQNNKLEVLPDLSTSWEATEDLKTWIFHLRPGSSSTTENRSRQPTSSSPTNVYWIRRSARCCVPR